MLFPPCTSVALWEKTNAILLIHMISIIRVRSFSSLIMFPGKYSDLTEKTIGAFYKVHGNLMYRVQRKGV